MGGGSHEGCEIFHDAVLWHVQGLSLTSNLPSLPYYDSLRHLIIETHRMECVIVHLPKLGASCTLKLESLSMRQPQNLALNVTALKELEHLTIVNFYVNSIAAPRGCMLHACWEDKAYEGNNVVSLEAWLCSTMGSSANIPLASLLLHDSSGSTTAGLQALEEILSGERRFDVLSLELSDLMESDMPLEVSEHRWQGILRARNLRLAAVDKRVLVLLSGIPSWERLSLEADEHRAVCLFTHSMSSLAGLQDFNVYGMQQVPLAVQLGTQMARAGRRCHVRLCTGPAPAWLVQGGHHITSVSEDDMSSFDEIMTCGCQCCLLCLRRDGILPRDFRELPRMHSPFGTLRTLA